MKLYFVVHTPMYIECTISIPPDSQVPLDMSSTLQQSNIE